MKIIAGILWLLFAAVGLSEESAVARLGFKGDPLGTDLKSFVEKYDRATNDSSQRAPFLKFGDVMSDGETPKEKAVNLRSLGIVVVQKSYPFEHRGKDRSDTIAGVPAESSFEFYAERLDAWDKCAAREKEHRARIKAWTDALMAGDRDAKRAIEPGRAWNDDEKAAATTVLLGSIRVRFEQRDFATVTTALSEKYGPPIKRETTVLQNAMGATFPCAVLHWTQGEDQIEATEREGKIDESVVVFECRSITARATALARSSAKKSASDL